MEKKQATAKQKRTEPLRRIDNSALQAVAGGARLFIPTGFADDGTPIYDDTAG